MRYGIMFHHFHDEEHHQRGQGSISADEFEILLKYVGEQMNFCTPEEYLSKLQTGTLTPNDACLTFDDALKCQADIAAPVLKKLGLKAFFFVYSGAFSETPDPLEFYRDFRTTMFANMDAFYELFFAAVRTNHADAFRKFVETYPEDYLAAFPFYTDGDKKFRFIRNIVLSEQSYFQIMEEMLQEKGYSKSKRKPFLFMSRENLQQLSSQGHVMGLHSDSHPTNMARCSDSSQEQEYSTNKKFLEGVVEESIWSMSHPCGSYNDTTLALLKNLGIEIGFRSSLNELEIKSELEIPREDHSNIMKLVREKNL